jgi:hypothetical protein
MALLIFPHALVAGEAHAVKTFLHQVLVIASVAMDVLKSL